MITSHSSNFAVGYEHPKLIGKKLDVPWNCIGVGAEDYKKKVFAHGIELVFRHIAILIPTELSQHASISRNSLKVLADAACDKYVVQ
jgi:hypothetical protein